VIEPRFLLDTSICIYVLEGIGTSLRSRIEQHVPGELVTSAICHAEVMKGLLGADAGRRAQAERLFDLFEVMPFDRDASLAYGGLPFRRGSFGRLIAAHALSLGLTLVTNNEADFADVPGLKVENWTLPL